MVQMPATPVLIRQLLLLLLLLLVVLHGEVVQQPRLVRSAA
jgi:hypothetical protein